MSEFKTGTSIKDRYILKEFKGSGSFGEVWQAHDEILDCDVAIKIYISLDPRGVEEFKSEYITTQGISHPNLLTTTYFDVWEQHPFLVMKYCAKGSSSKLAGKIDEYALWQFIHDVSAGLKFLHELPEPIIHQDIKPDNILVDDTDRYLITDFGISKKIRSTMRKQSKRAIGAGATAYMGPERFESDPTPVKASDIWSLGVSIYELATGELPFSGLGGGMLRNGAEIPSFDKKWSKEMNMVMQCCLAKETWNRPTAQQLEEYSMAIINGQPAKVTWTLPTVENEASSNDIAESNESLINRADKAVEKTHSNKKRIWFTVATIIAAIILFIIIVPIKQVDKSRTAPEGIAGDVDSTAVIMVEEENINVQKNESYQTTREQAVSSTKQQPNKEESKNVEVEDPKIDSNATLLKNALANGDYQQVQKLANQGYSAAYGPLAKYYLSNHDYETAEFYAKKAKVAGYSEGSAVIKTLENLGYYD